MFSGTVIVESSLRLTLASQPPTVSPWDSVIEAFKRSADVVAADRAMSRLRREIISRNPELREREVLKSVQLEELNGLTKFGTRYYDPTTGRFTRADPSGQERNTYAYVGRKPVNATDPTGRISLDCGLAIAAYFVAEASLIGLSVASFGAAAVLAIIGFGIGTAAVVAACTKARDVRRGPMSTFRLVAGIPLVLLGLVLAAVAHQLILTILGIALAAVGVSMILVLLISKWKKSN